MFQNVFFGGQGCLPLNIIHTANQEKDSAPMPYVPPKNLLIVFRIFMVFFLEMNYICTCKCRGVMV